MLIRLGVEPIGLIEGGESLDTTGFRNKLGFSGVISLGIILIPSKAFKSCSSFFWKLMSLRSVQLVRWAAFL